MNALLAQLSQIRGAKFASFVYRSKETGELARYVVNLGTDFVKLYKADRETMQELLPSLSGIYAEAGTALLKSIEESLAKGLGNNSAYTHGPEQGDTYVSVPGAPGVKLNTNDNVLHVVGVLHRKEIIEAGEYKEVNSRPLTIAKRTLEKAHLKRAKVRQFRFPNISTAKLNGEVLELA